LISSKEEAMNLKRWFYRDGRPNRLARALDRVTAALYALGVAPNYLVTLEVPGRRSGRTIAVPLVMTVVGNERYLVSMLGEGNWVKNVSSAGGAVTIRHGRREEARLEKVPIDRRAPVLKAYLQRARNARAHLPVNTDAPLTEFEGVSAKCPVFRVLPRKRVPASQHSAEPVRSAGQPETSSSAS
jgi:hypothetical protein